MKKKMQAAVLASMLGLGMGAQVHATGIPTVDIASLIQEGMEIAEIIKQLETAKQQLDQLQQTYNSLNKITNMGDVAALLNDPKVRRALPDNFSDVEGLLRGDGGDERYKHYLDANSYYDTQPVDANDFYAQELQRTRKQSAAELTLAEKMYAAATKRIEGIDQLRAKIGQSKDQKDIMDLQARLQAENAYLQTDVLRMQSLAMVQQAQAKTDQQRHEERMRKTNDEMKAILQDQGTSGEKGGKQ